MSTANCPHCNFLFDDSHIWEDGDTEFPKEENDTVQTECVNCNKKLFITLRLDYIWSFEDENGFFIDD